MHFRYRGVRYHIASNTATTITLDTPDTAYDDLSTVSITIIKSSDYFWKDADGDYTQINDILKINNTNNLTTEINEKSLDNLLEQIEGRIHDELNRIGNPILQGTRGYSSIQGVAMSAVQRSNQARQWNKLTNQMEIVFGSFVPWFSPQETATLKRVDSEADQAYVFDMKYTNGAFIHPSVNGRTNWY